MVKKALVSQLFIYLLEDIFLPHGIHSDSKVFQIDVAKFIDGIKVTKYLKKS